MSYLKRTLLKDERVVYETHKHWIIFFLPLIFTIAGWILLSQSDLLILLGFLSLLIAAFYWCTSMMLLLTTEFAVTNRRVLIKTGFIRRQSWETLLSKIATLEVSQSLLGRILNYGTLSIQNTGGTKDAFTMVTHPLLFRQKIQEEADATEFSSKGNHAS